MPASHYYDRPAPVLPPADSLPYPANLIVDCRECGLHNGCTRPVPAANIQPCEIMLVGEAPGRNEDEQGNPFVGMAGQYLDSLLFQSGIPRESVCISNVVHCRPPNNRTPRADEIQACSKWLKMEMDIVRPRIIVALGKPATDVFLPGNGNTMEHLHGKPVEKDGRIILPCYHPAFALRDTSKMRQASEDFQVLRGLVKGKDWREYHVIDEYPNPVYRVADTPDLLAEMESEIAETGEFAVDTEICRGKLWSVQISAKSGTAWFIPIPDSFIGKYDLTDLPGTAIVHNYLFDINYLNIREDDFVDSMTQAYLLGEPQGLKELANRLCGIQMITYKEIVSKGQQKLSLEYLQKASGVEWPDPPTIEETKWDNKKGCLATKTKKPWRISRKITKMLEDFKTDGSTDLWDRWKNVPEEERAVVESVIGVMPESSLADIPFEQAVQYASRDADATLRVYHKLKKMITDLDLDFVLNMDLGILPMVNSMMQNGMAIDLDHFRKLSEDYDIRMRVMSEEMAGRVGHPFNPNSSDQVAVVVYGELGFTPTKKTPTGKISTDDAELKKTKHPVAESIIRYRGIQKLKSTYADALIEWARPDEQGVPRVHTTLKTTRVETGRLACVPLDTEILTSLGWKRWYEVKCGAAVLGYNITHNAYEWTKLIYVHRGTDVLGGLKVGTRRRKEEMVYCTPDHKWIVGLKQSDRDNKQTPDLIGVSEAKHLGETRLLTPILQLDTVAPPFPAPYWTITSTAAGIIGWAITDGHIISTSSGRRSLSIRLRKTSSVQAVEKLLKDGNVTHTRSTYNKCDEDFYIGVDVFEPLWSLFLDELGPEQYIVGLSTDAKQAMFDAMMEADGNVDGKHNRWSKKSDSIARTVMELLCLFLGKRFTSRYYSTHNGAPMQEIHFLGLNRYASNVSYRIESREVHEVWCPETELGTWVMRQGRHIAITGNSADPNLQNIPTRNKESKQIKNGFIAPDGWLLAEGDLGQIEMRTQAHLARCKGLIELFLSGRDPHTTTAARIFGVPYEEAGQNKYRYPTKRAGFGIIYLIGAMGLSTQINEYIADLQMEGEPVDIDPWDETTCQKFIDDYYLLYPEIRDYQQEKLAEARRYGYVRDPISGRIRFIPEVSCPIRSIAEGGARMAANFPVTTSAQAVIKASMGRLWQELPKTEWSDAKYLLQIHDSLLFEILDSENYIQSFLAWVKDIMVSTITLSVPIDVDFKVGSHWGELEKHRV